VRALVAGDRWQPFRAALAGWLEAFEPSSRRLLLVGPSAGYTFPDRFLQRFEHITLFEPDPLAVWLLSRRLHRLGVQQLHVERGDALLRPLLDGRPGLAERMAGDPEACLVFGNLLGQTRFLLSEQEFALFKVRFNERISPLLAGRSWLSFHDRLSGSLAPSFRAPHFAAERLSDPAVLQTLYRSQLGTAPAELFDHQSDGFFPSRHPHAYFHWQIDGARHHLIEGVGSFEPRRP